jgi:hypothetical protein
MKKWKVIVASDKGIISLKATAKTKAIATAMVMKAENCPSYAILKITEMKVPAEK